MRLQLTAVFFCVLFVILCQLDVMGIYKDVEGTTADLTEQFGGKRKSWLVNFLQVHGQGRGKKVRVRSVDGEGRPINHMYTMHKRQLPGHKYDSTYVDYVKLCRSHVKSAKLAVEEQAKKRKDKEGEDGGGATRQNEDDKEGEDEADVEEEVDMDQELVDEEEEDHPFLSDDEDVEEVFHINKPMH
ncbi:unnamed protein product [Closterium sp. NIES-64]|nr:unnamed protein product [Closterium sp. NIES-64]